MGMHEENKSRLIQGMPALILSWIFRKWDEGHGLD
jgi:hypothetical protein